MSRTSTEWPIKLETGDSRPDDWDGGACFESKEHILLSPCKGCGYCCISVPCYLSSDEGWWDIDHCVMLVWSKKDNRYWCQAILDNPAIGKEWDLAVGAGCCSPLNTWRNNVKERRTLISK